MRESVFANLTLGWLTRVWSYFDGLDIVSDILVSDCKLYSSWLICQIEHRSSFIQAGHQSE